MVVVVVVAVVTVLTSVAVVVVVTVVAVVAVVAVVVMVVVMVVARLEVVVVMIGDTSMISSWSPSVVPPPGNSCGPALSGFLLKTSFSISMLMSSSCL